MSYLADDETMWNEILGRYHSNKTSLTELVHGTFYFLGFYIRYLEFLRISSPWPVLGIKDRITNDNNNNQHFYSAH